MVQNQSCEQFFIVAISLYLGKIKRHYILQYSARILSGYDLIDDIHFSAILSVFYITVFKAPMRYSFLYIVEHIPLYLSREKRNFSIYFSVNKYVFLLPGLRCTGSLFCLIMSQYHGTGSAAYLSAYPYASVRDTMLRN